MTDGHHCTPYIIIFTIYQWSPGVVFDEQISNDKELEHAKDSVDNRQSKLGSVMAAVVAVGMVQAFRCRLQQRNPYRCYTGNPTQQTQLCGGQNPLHQ